MNIPKDATHRNSGHFYRKVEGTWQMHDTFEWVATSVEQAWLDANADPLPGYAAESEALSKQKAIYDIINLIGWDASADNGAYEAAERVYDAGYRKFEIVEEDV